MKPRWTGASMLVAAVAVGLLPMVASAADLPAPTPATPTSGATVDQPVFSWSAVDGAAYYEIEVSLDDQFVTVTDPGDEKEPRKVHGTTYVPTVTYSAKTLYWHVRAVAGDGSPGGWSAPRRFTRRWTDDDEAAGVEQTVPASRVENVRTITGDSSPPLNQVGFAWDPVPGAAYYEVRITAATGHTVRCLTPHTQLVPGFSEEYVRRLPLSPCTDLLSPIRSWIDSAGWRSPEAGSVSVEAEDVRAGDLVFVRFLNKTGTSTVVAPWETTAVSVGGDPLSFTVPAPDLPADPAAKAQYFIVNLPVEPDMEYRVRVRAVDSPNAPDYPTEPEDPPAPVYGMWSDEAREPGEPLPPDVVITPSIAEPGSGSPSTPVVPDDQAIEGTDSPVLSWEPVPGAVAYRVVIALDRDFTNRVAGYLTRNAVFLPPETYDDNGPNASYYWFAVPCGYSTVKQADVSCPVADREAINNPVYVGRFAKRSAPPSALTASAQDSSANALLRWGDALTAAQTLHPAFTPGGVEKYEVQFTRGTWSKARSILTDNLAYSTAAGEPLESGDYRWRVRPLDGQAVPLAWASGQGFTIVQPKSGNPSPNPSASTPNPGSSTPGPVASTGGGQTGPPPVYETPPPAQGTASRIPPDKPGKPKVTRSGKRKVRVHWQASEELGEPVSEYLVYRSSDGKSFTIARHTTSTTVRLKAKRAKAYWFYIVADSDAGRSEASAVTRFTR